MNRPISSIQLLVLQAFFCLMTRFLLFSVLLASRLVQKHKICKLRKSAFRLRSNLLINYLSVYFHLKTGQDAC